MAGSSHANRGMGWEALLAWRHKEYGRLGMAVIRHNHPRVHRGRDLQRGEFAARYLEKAPPDFTILCPDWSFLADAKETRDRTWSWELLEPHQATDLDEMDRLGGRSAGLLLLHFAPVHEAYVVAWADVRDRWYAWRAIQVAGQICPRGQGSLSRVDAEQLALWSGRTVLADLDYLPTTIAALEQRLARRAAG